MAGIYVAMFQSSFAIPVMVLLLVLGLRVILRRPWLAYAAMFALVLSVNLAAQEAPVLELAIMTSIMVSLVILVLTRLGLLAFLVAINFSYWSRIALTTDPGSWHFASSVVTMLLLAALAVYGFIVSLGGQALFKDPVLD